MGSDGGSRRAYGVNALGAYLRDIRRYGLLTTSGERKLAVRTRNGEERAWTKLVQANLRLVVKIAKRYQGGVASLEDLIEEGNIGLMEAARRFDPTRGVRFGSYASWWIRKYVRAAVGRQKLQAGFPVEARSTSLSGSGETWRSSPSVPRSNGVRLLWRRILSFDEFPGNSSGNHPIESRVAAGGPGPEELLNDSQVADSLHEVLEMMSERECQILEARHGLNGRTPMSLQQIADSMGCTREWVRQLEQRALSRARNILEGRKFRR